MTSASFEKTLTTLNRASLHKRFDAYLDIDWDHPDHRIEHDDPRWELDADHPLGDSDWYRSLPQATRARLGLHLIVSQMKLGVDFEGVLGRGLLELAGTLPCGAPEKRYAYHELIEEAQHQLMFQEFVARSRLAVTGLSGIEAWSSRGVVRMGRTFPELFFLFVLGGEAPIDHQQRHALRTRGPALHPLLRRVISIHVTEEARHLCFAESFLRERVPRLSAWRRLQLTVRAPILFKAMSLQMLAPPRDLSQCYRIPRAVLKRCYRDDPRHRAQVLAGLASVRRLCSELGVVGARSRAAWRWLGIWDDDAGVPVLA